MPRRPRVFVDGATYHVYCRVARGEPVFRDQLEAGALVETLATVKRRDELTVFAWCVMSNHYHVVVRTARVPLWRSMRLVQGRFAKGYNRRHEIAGPLWQGRYKAKLVHDGDHLRQVVAYVHLNPVMAGVVNDPAQHRLSGHLEVLKSAAQGQGLVDVDETLVLFGERREAALRGYLSALQMVSRARWAREDPEHLPWWTGGSPDQILRLRAVPRLDALGASSEPEPAVLSPEEFVLIAAGALSVDLVELIGPRAHRSLTRVREMLALLGVERYRLRVKDLAQRLARDPSVVSRWVSIAGELRTSNGEFRESFERFAAKMRTQALPQPAQPDESEFITGVDNAFVD
jgi:REP element-mobilizing transposase RayT